MVATVSLIGKLSKIGNFESCIWEFEKILFAFGNDSKNQSRFYREKNHSKIKILIVDCVPIQTKT